MTTVSYSTESDRTSVHVDQSARNLRLALFTLPIEPTEFFTVFAQENCLIQGAQMRLTVIGASHLVEVRCGDAVFCELLSCANGLISSPVLELPATQATVREIRHRDPQVQYKFRMNLEAISQQTRNLPSRLIPQCAFQVSASFPGIPGRPNPITIIGADYQTCNDTVADRFDITKPAAIVNIHSVHWYESEGVAAVSRSQLKLCTGES